MMLLVRRYPISLSIVAASLWAQLWIYLGRL